MALTEHDFEFRPNEVGGSEVAAIVGRSKYTTAAEVLQRKLAGTNGQPEPTPQQQRKMERGKAMEEFVLQLAHEHHQSQNAELVELAAREEGYPIRDKSGKVVITSHPDARFEVRSRKGAKTLPQQRLLEIKTTADRSVIYQHQTDVAGDMSKSHLPEYWRIQVQMEMHGANQAGMPVESMDLMCYDLINDDVRHYTESYNREECEALVEQVSAWKDKYLDNPNGRTADARLLEAWLDEQLEFERRGDPNMRRSDKLALLNIEPEPDSIYDVRKQSTKTQNAIADAFDKMARGDELSKAGGELKRQGQQIIRDSMEACETLRVDGVDVATFKNIERINGRKQLEELSGNLKADDSIRLTAERLVGELKQQGVQNATAKRVFTALRAVIPFRIEKETKEVMQQSASKSRTLRMGNSKAARQTIDDLAHEAQDEAKAVGIAS